MSAQGGQDLAEILSQWEITTQTTITVSLHLSPQHSMHSFAVQSFLAVPIVLVPFVLTLR